MLNIRKIIIFFVILFFADFLFASIKVLENSDGRIVAKVSFDEFVYEKYSNPMIFLNFTADKNSKPQISAVPQNRFTIKVSDKQEKQTFSPVLNQSFARNIPVFSAGISQILNTSENEITYTTEVIVTINYSSGNSKNSIPKSDYYDAIISSILNPDKVKNTILSSSAGKRTLRDAGSFNSVKSTAVRFWIGDSASRSNEKEADLQEKTGIYKITPKDLELLGKNLPISSIRIRSANPNVFDSITPNVDDSLKMNGLVDVPLILRDKNGDGIFNVDDDILFYAEKIHRWIFNENTQAWNFSFNYTDFRRYYWITIDGGGKKMQEFSQSNGAGLQQKTSADIYYHGKRSVDLTTAYNATYGHGDKRFVWKSLTSSDSKFDSPDFPNNFIVNSLAGNSQIRLFAHENTGFTYFDLSIGEQQIPNRSLGTWISFQNVKSPEPTRKFSFSAKFSGGTGRKYLDFDSYELKYSQNLSMKNAKNLQFYSPEGAKTSISYKISDLPQNENYLFIRHNPKTQQTEFIDISSANGVFSDESGNGFKYHLASESGFLSIQNAEVIALSQKKSDFHIVDLLNTSNQVDYLIISPNEFLTQAIKLAEHKKNTGQFLYPKVVCTQDIFNTFGGGTFSPEAVRNFVLYAQKKWLNINGAESPDYLVLFGSGHFDYKNIISNVPNHVPVYVATATNDFHKVLVSYAVEDFFTYTIENSVPGITSSLPQMIVGRIPVVSTQEADGYLQKIKELEASNADFSSWRNRPLLLADDDVEFNINVQENIYYHTRQSDSIAIIIKQFDKSTDIRKVTLFEYPFAGQYLKPLAREALISEINKGVSLVNYFGHGAYDMLSHQEVFRIGDVTSLTNSKHYFIFGAFSCSVGFFDHPKTEGLSEKLVRESQRGAINAISSVRTAWAGENGVIAKKFYADFYDTSGTKPKTVGQAYLSAKQYRNLPTFSLLGDPSYTPMLNRKKFSNIKILNEKKEPVDTLKKMQNVIISGSLGIANDGIARKAEVILQNPENLTPVRKDGLTFQIPQYTLPGMVAARQEFEFTGNSFEIPLMIPPSVIDTTLGSRLMIHVRNKNGGNDIFTAVKDSGIIFSGFDTTNIDINDKEGPTIVAMRVFSDSIGRSDTTKNQIVGNRITIDGFNKSSGTATIGVHISDKSGIDIFSSETPGGGVSVSIERVMNKRQYNKEDLTLIDDDFRNCSLSLQLSQEDFPAVGEYELIITSRDILQNITTKRYILDVKSLKDEQYTIGDFFCYPSPVSMGQQTQFFFNQPVDNVSEISLKIYTLNGKLVRSFPNVRRGQYWDLTDQRGQKLSPNVYLYRLFVKRYKRSDNGYQNSGTKTEIIKSKVKKLVIYPPK